MLGATIGVAVAEVPKPQSLPAMHPLAADDVGEAQDTLRDQPRVLDEVGCRVEHAGDQHLVVGDADRREVFPFMLVARVGGLDAQALRARLQRRCR